MYNGIGLQTARGSGTNGYVQTNKFNIRIRSQKFVAKEFQEGEGAGGVTRKPNKDILDHDRKRQIELKLVMLQDTLEEQGYTDEEVQDKVDALRKELESAKDEPGFKINTLKTEETHQVAARKEQKMSRMKEAFGLGEVKEGEAFDREIQEQKRLDRIAGYEARKEERAEKERQDKEGEKKRDKEDQERKKDKEDRERRKDKDDKGKRKDKEGRERRREKKHRHD